MADGKKSFVLYCDQKGIWDKLDDSQAGKLIKHIIAYVNDENPVSPDFITELAFEPIKQQLKRDLKKWEQTTANRSIAGKAGAESKWGKSDSHILRSERLSIARTKGTHTKQQWDELLQICDHRCVICGSLDIVKDHITPIYQGGSDGIDNLQPLCKSCNSRKGPDNTNHLTGYINKMPSKIKNAYQSLAKMAVNVNDNVTVNVNDNVIIYKNAGEAWKDITSDTLFLERLVRIVRGTGATEENVLKATKYFLTLEDAKPNFDLRPRDEVKKHLVNWLNTQKKNVTAY